MMSGVKLAVCNLIFIFVCVCCRQMLMHCVVAWKVHLGTTMEKVIPPNERFARLDHSRMPKFASSSSMFES